MDPHSRIRLVTLALLVAVVSLSAGLLRAQQPQQGQQRRLIMVTEEHIRPGYAAAFEQYRKDRNAKLAKNRREFSFTAMTARDSQLSYVFKTHGLRDLSDYERWSALNIQASEGVTTPQGPNPIDYQEIYYLTERPDWSYVPASPRLSSGDAPFVHWDVYYTIGSPSLWNMTPTEASAAGYLDNNEFFRQMTTLYSARNIRDGFNVYSTYALSTKNGPALIIETWGRDAKDYYSQLVQTQKQLGAEGLALVAGRLGASKQLVRRDFTARPDLSYTSPR